MSSISNVSSRRTEELVDALAHDAGIVDKDHHVRSNAGTRSQQQRWKERNDEHAEAHAAGFLGTTVADQFLEHASVHGIPKIGLHGMEGPANGAIFVGSVGVLYVECLKELDRAEKKADELRNAADNDAVNVALARTLAFDPRFAVENAVNRPGVEQSTAKIEAKLKGEDADIKAVLQQRADEGFVAMKRAFDATKNMPPKERAVAMQKWLTENGFRERMRNDVAFGKGAEYLLWCAGTKGVDLEAETKKVTNRMPPEQRVHVKG